MQEEWVVCWGGEITNRSIMICSNDFTHDICLTVTGDFEDIHQKIKYAEEIARKLNDEKLT